MKNQKHPLLQIAAVMAVAAIANMASVRADDKHDHKGHDHSEKQFGPNGGRIITAVEPHLEFLVTADRKVKIIAVGDDNKPINLKKQSVKVFGGDRSNPTKMKFKKEGNTLVSDVAFPAGNDFPVIVQIKNSPVSKKVLEKFNLNLKDCPTCEVKEYACICDHGHEHGDHDHKHGKHDHKGHKH